MLDSDLWKSELLRTGSGFIICQLKILMHLIMLIVIIIIKKKKKKRTEEVLADIVNPALTIINSRLPRRCSTILF